MHEEAILRDLRRKLEEIAVREGGVRIVRVVVRVGALAHLPAAGLRARWPETVAGTAADGARLEVESSSAIDDPRADGIVLVRVDVADGPGGAPPRPAPAGEVLREPDHP